MNMQLLVYVCINIYIYNTLYMFMYVYIILYVYYAGSLLVNKCQWGGGGIHVTS